ncbi:hypothetical protein Nmel_011048, partial [Mimus melanotis]
MILLQQLLVASLHCRMFETWEALDEWQRRQQGCTADSTGLEGGMKEGASARKTQTP